MTQPPDDDNLTQYPGQDDDGIPPYLDPDDEPAESPFAEDDDGIPSYQDADEAAPAADPTAGGQDLELYLAAMGDTGPYSPGSGAGQYQYSAEPDPSSYPYLDDDGLAAEEGRETGVFSFRPGRDSLVPLVIFIGLLITIISVLIFTSGDDSQVVDTNATGTPTTGIALVTGSPQPGETRIAGATTRPSPSPPRATTRPGAETDTANQPGFPYPDQTDTANQPGYPGPGGPGTNRTQIAGLPEETPTSYPGPPTGIGTPMTQAPLPTTQPTQPPPPTYPPQSTYTPLPTYTPFPTEEPPPTREPPEPEEPEPTDTPEVPEEPTLVVILPTPFPTPIPLPTQIPVNEFAGETRWTASRSPIILDQTVRLLPGSTLLIEPGVEVRLRPGVAIFIEGGQMLALGQPGQPVRFVADDFVGQRWDGIYGLTGSLIVLEHAELSGGGAKGTVLASQEGELAIRSTRIHDNGGTVIVTDSRFEMRDSEIAANDIPFGAALNANYNFGNVVTLINNRIGGNRLSDGASGVEISNFNTFDGLGLDIQGNMIRGGFNSNLHLSTSGPIYGTIACNAFIGDTLGLGLRTQTLQVPAPDLKIENNFIDEHTPVIEPTYLDFGIGRGATSEIALDMSNNWWGAASGPYHPEGNPEGRGNAVGSNISYEPWLEAPPACAPHQ